MLVQLTTRRGIPICKTVASYREASEAVRKFVGSKPNSLSGGPHFIADGGKIVAHVSYNGRVWPGREWQSGMVPLYDPQQVV